MIPIRSSLFTLLAGLLCMPLSALAGSPEAQAAPKRNGLGTLSEQKRPEATQAEERTLKPLPAPEVVQLKCPAKLTYQAQLSKNDPELAGWTTSQVGPGKVEALFRFSEVSNLDTYSWKGASSVECQYDAEIQKNHYRTTLSRKVHASGTPYRCKVKKSYGPEVECRLSITPF
jgi:hypothetical protein